MRATLERYLWRNERIGERRVYICRSDLARLMVEGMEIEDGTMATITDTFDFDAGFMYTLDDGSKTRFGGNSWIGPNGEFDGTVFVTSLKEFMRQRAELAAPYFEGR